MATASVPGYGGSITGLTAASGTAVTEITDWEVNLELDDEDTTSFASSGYKEYTSTLIGATVNFNAVGLQIPPLDRTKRTLTLKAKASGGPEITGEVCCRSTNITCPVTGVVKYAFQGVFSGSITVTNP